MSCFRYLDFKSFEEVDRLIIPEFNLLMEAVNLKQVDQDYRNHLQAYLNFAVKAERKSGRRSKPVYKKFKDFFNYPSAIKEAKERFRKSKKDKGGGQSRFSGIGELLDKGVSE